MSEYSHALIASVGGQPQIVTLTLDLLLRQHIKINEVIVLHLESVVPETTYPRRLNTRNPQGLDDRKRDYLRKVRILREAFGAGPHEKLSAIDLLKCLGPVSNAGDDFPSTSHVAVLPFLHGLLKLDTTKQVQAAGGLDAYIQEPLEIKEILHAL